MTDIFNVKSAFLVYALINIITFFLYGIDKQKAKKGKWRISEKCLLLFSFFFGAIGGIAGMNFFHHKTAKWYFHFVCIMSVILQVVLIYFILKKNII